MTKVHLSEEDTACFCVAKSILEKNSIRIEKAKELLEGTDIPIDRIAYKLGLDHSNLIRQFKRRIFSSEVELFNKLS